MITVYEIQNLLHQSTQHLQTPKHITKINNDFWLPKYHSKINNQLNLNVNSNATPSLSSCTDTNLML